jgi:hypothetical protein
MELVTEILQVYFPTISQTRLYYDSILLLSLEVGLKCWKRRRNPFCGRKKEYNISMLQSLLYFTLKKLLSRKFALEEPIGRSRNARDDNIDMNPRYVGCDVMDLVEVPENKSPVVNNVIKLLEI